MCGVRFPLQRPGCEGGRQLQHRQDGLSQGQVAPPPVLQPQAPGHIALRMALQSWGRAGGSLQPESSRNGQWAQLPLKTALTNPYDPGRGGGGDSKAARVACGVQNGKG